VQIQGAWYLLDATWDDPVSKDGTDSYQTDYLFIPPSVATLDHFPEDERWQLRADPLSRGEFLRQPFARPGLARESLALLTPDRSEVEVLDSLELRLANPRRLHVMARLYPDGSDAGADCGVDDGAEVRLRCGCRPRAATRRASPPTRRATDLRSVAMIQVTRADSRTPHLPCSPPVAATSCCSSRRRGRLVTVSTDAWPWTRREPPGRLGQRQGWQVPLRHGQDTQGDRQRPPPGPCS
jgi:hypothetical protein